MSVNLQMSQAMNVKMGGSGPSRMTSNAQLVSQQQQAQQQQQQQAQQQQQHPQHHHQQQQSSTQQHPSMMRTQQQQSFTQQQQATMSSAGGNPYQQRNMGSGYGANPHQQQQQYQQTNAMQPAPVVNPTSLINNANNGLPPRNSFSPSDFNFDFLDQPLANDSKNGFNNKQQTFGDFNFDFLDAH